MLQFVFKKSSRAKIQRKNTGLESLQTMQIRKILSDADQRLIVMVRG